MYLFLLDFFGSNIISKLLKKKSHYKFMTYWLDIYLISLLKTPHVLPHVTEYLN